jgi:hypothetical protein
MTGCRGFRRMNMHAMRKKHGLAIGAVLALLASVVTTGHAKNQPSGPAYSALVYIEYYNNAIPSGVITQVYVGGGPTYASCVLEVLGYINNQNAVPSKRYIFRRADQCTLSSQGAAQESEE